MLGQRGTTAALGQTHILYTHSRQTGKMQNDYESKLNCQLDTVLMQNAPTGEVDASSRKAADRHAGKEEGLTCAVLCR